jgi:hypothetical protein
MVLSTWVGALFPVTSKVKWFVGENLFDSANGNRNGTEGIYDQIRMATYREVRPKNKKMAALNT